MIKVGILIYSPSSLPKAAEEPRLCNKITKLHKTSSIQRILKAARSAAFKIFYSTFQYLEEASTSLSQRILLAERSDALSLPKGRKP